MAETLQRLSNREVKTIGASVYAAISALGDTAHETGLEKDLLELTNLRASQINGCAYCVQYHITLLKELGIPEAKINLVVVWQEAGIFSARESAALTWTEALTLIASNRVPDDVYAEVSSHFTPAELISLTASVSTINVWNRLSIAFRFPPEID